MGESWGVEEVRWEGRGGNRIWMRTFICLVGGDGMGEEVVIHGREGDVEDVMGVHAGD